MTPTAPKLTDAQLLRAYRAERSQAAFGELVGRHIHLVHAAASRRTGDSHLADDVTQAVFVVLARRAASIGDGAMLTGWLLKTTQYAAMNALKLESRRRFHEQQAAKEARLSQREVDAPRLAATLDCALARLNVQDRSAIAMRYLQGKALVDVGRELGISVEAAQKRVRRALFKLRDVLARLGVHATADALDADLSSSAAHVAPAGLAPLIISHGIGSAAHSTAIAWIAKATTQKMVIVPLKLLAGGLAAGLLIAGGVTSVVVTSGGNPARAAAPAVVVAPAAPAAPTVFAAPAAAPSTQPGAVALPNIAFFANYNGTDFTAGIDSDTVRTPGGEAAAILTSDTPHWGAGGSSFQNVDSTPYRGKRIRFSAWVKCEGLANWGNLWILTGDLHGRVYSNDDDCEHAVTKTSDWKRFERVCDIPDGCDMIHCGLELRGKGKIWLDGATIEVVPDTVPITDDQNWHAWSYSMPHYSTRMDESQKRNGRATRLMTSTVASSGEWLSWDHNDRHPEPFLGKKAKVSMWIKTENVTGPSGLLLDCRGANFVSIIPGLSKDQRTIRGTTNWTRYEFTAEIPPETQDLCTGVRLGGKGKLWVDDIRCEVVK